MAYKFILKPIVVEAVQWRGDNFEEILSFIRPLEMYGSCGITLYSNNIELESKGGTTEIGLNDYFVINYMDNDISIYASEAFHERYEKVEE